MRRRARVWAYADPRPRAGARPSPQGGSAPPRGGGTSTPLVAPRAVTLQRVTESPLHAHASTPRELTDRIAAERAGSAFLLYRNGHGNQVILPLRGERVTIGRRPSNDVALDWDSEVSRAHATLERSGDDWTLVDDGLSHNGTYVGGDRITGRRRLQDGDVISVGATAIAFCAPGGGSSSMQTVTSVGPR